MDMDPGLEIVNHFPNHGQGKETVGYRLLGKPENKVHMGLEARPLDQTRRFHCLFGRMAAVYGRQDRIAPGLGAKHDGLVPTVFFNQLQGFGGHPVGADLRGVTAKMDPRGPGFIAPGKKFLDGHQVRLLRTFRPVSKGIRGNKGDLPVPQGDPFPQAGGQIADFTVPQTAAENPGGLAKVATI